MKYYDIERMCRPTFGLRGCPFDGLGCTGGKHCSINSENPEKRSAAFNADRYGNDFVCHKRETRKYRREAPHD